MLIDWFTVIAQIINFLILIWLLKRLLFRPILRAIDKREKQVADKLSQAASAEAEAKQMKEALQLKNEQFYNQQVESTREMKAQVELERTRLLEQVSQEISEIRQKQQSVLSREAHEFDQSFRHQMGDAILAISSKVLRDLSGTDLADRIIQVFVNRLEQLDPAEISQIRLTAKSTEPAVVTSSMPIGETRRLQIKQALAKIVSGHSEPIFNTDPDLICGLSISRGGYRISWNLADYLESLHKTLEPLINLPDTTEENGGEAE